MSFTFTHTNTRAHACMRGEERKRKERKRGEREKKITRGGRESDAGGGGDRRREAGVELHTHNTHIHACMSTFHTSREKEREEVELTSEETAVEKVVAGECHRR